MIKPLQLCSTLRIIANHTEHDFYNGTISKMVLADIKEMGGVITQQDFDNYK